MHTVADVLARLRAERERLSAELLGVERAIVALETAAQAAEPVPAPPPPDLAPELPAALWEPEPPPPPGPYARLSFYEAVATYLQVEGEPKTVGEIVEALLAGGYPTGAANFRASARTMLRRPVSASPFGIYPSEDGERFFFRSRDAGPTG